MSDTPTLPPSAKLSSHMDFYSQKNRATQLRMIHPPPLPSAPRRVMHARGPLWSEYAGGRGDNGFSSNSMVRSHVQIQQDISPNESEYQPRDVRTSATTQKVGVHDTGYPQPEQRARLPHFFANRDSTEVAESSVRQAWCEKRARLPLPTETETVSATQKAHTTAKNSLSRWPDYPTFTQVDTVSIPQKAQIRRAVHPFSTQEYPQQRRRHT